MLLLHLSSCRYLDAQDGVIPQPYAHSLKCVSRDRDVFLRAASFTTGYVRLVGQEPAPIKCVLIRLGWCGGICMTAFCLRRISGLSDWM